MEIKNKTQFVQRGIYRDVVSDKKNTVKSSKKTAPATDAVVISSQARQAAMAAEMEKDGLSREAAEKLASGNITIKEPDWETFEVPTLQGQADRDIYNTAYLDAYTKWKKTPIKTPRQSMMQRKRILLPSRTLGKLNKRESISRCMSV